MLRCEDGWLCFENYVVVSLMLFALHYLSCRGIPIKSFPSSLYRQAICIPMFFLVKFCAYFSSQPFLQIYFNFYNCCFPLLSFTYSYVLERYWHHLLGFTRKLNHHVSWRYSSLSSESRVQNVQNSEDKGWMSLIPARRGFFLFSLFNRHMNRLQ
jgi:hypothetical protein